MLNILNVMAFDISMTNQTPQIRHVVVKVKFLKEVMNKDMSVFGGLFYVHILTPLKL